MMIKSDENRFHKESERESRRKSSLCRRIAAACMRLCPWLLPEPAAGVAAAPRVHSSQGRGNIRRLSSSPSTYALQPLLSEQPPAAAGAQLARKAVGYASAAGQTMVARGRVLRADAIARPLAATSMPFDRKSDSAAAQGGRRLFLSLDDNKCGSC